MKTRGTFIVKEVSERIQDTLLLPGTFSTRVPIKEVHEIKYYIAPITTTIGKHGIAYFGSVELQLYCIDSKDQNLTLLEHQLDFRGFSSCPERSHNKELHIDIEASVKDTFVEDICNETLKVFLVLQIELLLSVEKELEAAEISNSSGNSHYSVETIEDDSGLIFQNVSIE